MIRLDTDIDSALLARARQRSFIEGRAPALQSFLLNPYRFGGSSGPAAGPVWNAMTIASSGSGPIAYLGNSTFVSHQIATTTTIIRSTNGGQTWSTVTLPALAELRGIASDGAGKAIITCGSGSSSNVYFYTTDYGATWTNSTLPVSGFWYGRTYSNGVWVVAAYGGNIYTATNPAGSWTSRSGGGTSQRGVIGNGATNFFIWQDGSSTGRRSTDSGATWPSSGAMAFVSNQFFAAYSGSRLTIFGSSGNTRTYSDDFGSTWSASAALPSGANASTGPFYTNSPTFGGYMLAADNASNKMIVSTDGGNTWAFCTNTRLSSTVCYIATDGAGRWVYVPNFGTGSTAGGWADL